MLQSYDRRLWILRSAPVVQEGPVRDKAETLNVMDATTTRFGLCFSSFSVLLVVMISSTSRSNGQYLHDLRSVQGATSRQSGNTAVPGSSPGRGLGLGNQDLFRSPLTESA